MRIDAESGDAPGSATVIATVIARDKLGQVTSVTQGGKVRTYVYDSRFFVGSEIDPELGTITYGRDGVGNLTSKSVGTSGTTVYTLDNLYRVDLITYPDGVTTPSVDYEYYPDSTLRYVTKGATRWDYDYDPNGNLTTETLTASGRSYPFVNGYNSLDSLSSIAYPSGITVSYQPNALGQPTQVSSALGTHASAITFYPNGQMKGFTAGNGYRTDLGQNTRLFPTTLTSSTALNGGLVTATSLNHVYDPAGNTTDITDYRDSTQTRHMTYDGVNRLRVADGAWGAGAFTYDARNNILTKQLGSQSLTYGYNATTGRLDNIGGTYPRAYQYDVYGNVTANGTGAPYGVFGYDDASNMVSVGSGAIGYTYDGNSRMAVESWANGSLTRYTAYNRAGKLMYEDDTVNSEATDYIFLGSQMLAKRSRCTASTDTDGDGISNCNEWRMGLDKNNASDAAADTDGDGLTNLQEAQAGTNIYQADTDGDGLVDGYEVKYGLNAVVADSNSDFDNDGLTNLQEFQRGTKPNNRDTDHDGIPDGSDPKPLFNPAVLIPILQMLLD